MMGSTPIALYIFVSDKKEFNVVSDSELCAKELFSVTVPAKTESLDRTLPTTGNMASPLITFLRFMLLYYILTKKSFFYFV
jgi:hypothetical protein